MVPFTTIVSPSLSTLFELGTGIFYAGVVGSIVFYTQIYIPWIMPAAPDELVWLTDPYVEVYVMGAVELPGTYRMLRGETRGSVLTKARPLPTADLSRVKIMSKLKEGQLIEIPYITYITVFIKGEVEQEGALRVPKGTKLNQLEGRITLKPGADYKALMKKRVLKDGETIVVKGTILKRKTEKGGF
jgi:hypothetical protein